jgi:hypothetical protein
MPTLEHQIPDQRVAVERHRERFERPVVAQPRERGRGVQSVLGVAEPLGNRVRSALTHIGQGCDRFSSDLLVGVGQAGGCRLDPPRVADASERAEGMATDRRTVAPRRRDDHAKSTRVADVTQDACGVAGAGSDRLDDLGRSGGVCDPVGARIAESWIDDVAIPASRAVDRHAQDDSSGAS